MDIDEQHREPPLLKDLTFTSDYIFQKVMEDPDLARRITETILPIKWKDSNHSFTKRNLASGILAKGAVLDVYMEDGNAMVDLEMQTYMESGWEKRIRNYQSLLDQNALEKGAPYLEMKKSYVVFLCTFDLVGEGKFRWTYSRYSPELNQRLNDDAEIVIYNMKMREEAETDALRNLCDYAMTNVPKDTLTRDIDAMIQNVKQDSLSYARYLKNEFDRKWELTKSYQAGEEKGEAKGIAKGMAKGEAKGLAKGVAKGVAKGRVLGMKEGILRVAKKMKDAGYPMERISALCQLSFEEIQAL